jgi:hypothetical protein
MTLMTDMTHHDAFLEKLAIFDVWGVLEGESMTHMSHMTLHDAFSHRGLIFINDIIKTQLQNPLLILVRHMRHMRHDSRKISTKCVHSNQLSASWCASCQNLVKFINVASESEAGEVRRR